MQDVFHFTWQVPTGGFQWVWTRAYPPPVGTGKEGWFLTATEPPAGSGKARWFAINASAPPFTARDYAPLQEFPTLFLTFTTTPPTQEGILAFANHYGLLGGNIITQIHLPNGKAAWGELLDGWQTEITDLKRAVTLWEFLQGGHVERLAAHIVWGDKRVEYHPQAGRSDDAFPIASEDVHPDLLARFQPGDVGQPAWYHVQRVINHRLTGRVSTRLLWNRERTQLGLYHQPQGLIGALWLQFAQAINGNKQYHRCEYCGNQFEVSLEANRPTRVYCSDACRFKAYRKRQEDAYQLNREGVPLKEIAKRLGTDTATAKGWIKKRKEV